MDSTRVLLEYEGWEPVALLGKPTLHKVVEGYKILNKKRKKGFIILTEVPNSELSSINRKGRLLRII